MEAVECRKCGFPLWFAGGGFGFLAALGLRKQGSFLLALGQQAQFHLFHVFQAYFQAGARGRFAQQLFAAFAHGQQTHDAFLNFDDPVFQGGVVNPHRARDADERVERHGESGLGFLRFVLVLFVFRFLLLAADL